VQFRCLLRYSSPLLTRSLAATAAAGTPCTPGKRPRSPLKDAHLLLLGPGAAEGSDDAAVDNVRAQKRYLSEVCSPGRPIRAVLGFGATDAGVGSHWQAMASGLSRLNMRLSEEATSPAPAHGMDTGGDSALSEGAASPSGQDGFAGFSTPRLRTRTRRRSATLAGVPSFVL